MKILLTSNWHETPFAEKKFETQKESLGEKIIQVLGSEGSSQVMRRMSDALKTFDFSTVINNGDLQENSKNEQGLVSDADVQSAKNIIASFQKKHYVEMKLNAGNHELGYHKSSQPLATDPDGGISLQSTKNFKKLTGTSTLYQSFPLGDYQIVLIPYLMTEKEAKDFNVENKKIRILNRLYKELQGERKIILFIHDPDSLMDERLASMIRVDKNKIPLVFCGHYHAQMTLFAVRMLIRIFNWKILFPIRWALRLLLNIAFDGEISKAVQESYRQRKMVPSLMKEFDVQIIPAPGGMLGFGGGFLTLDLETLEIVKN
ncbi:MAG: metallophosphoesterase [Patescibacteria group bacterium]|nr:metallophosphoesterase [Patescibacteria group bacterium]